MCLNLQFPLDGDKLMEVVDVVSSVFSGRHMAAIMDRCFVLAGRLCWELCWRL